MSIDTSSTDAEAESSSSTPRTGSTTFINTSGGLLTDELVSKLRQRHCGESAVRPETFALPNAEPPEEADIEAEIGDTWDRLRERWDELTMDETLFHMDVSDARTKWILKLFQNLGFEPVFQRENLEAGGIEANLSHKGWPDGEIESYGEMEGRTAPIIHTVEPEQKLDEKSGDAPRGAKSPHDTLQEFLNASDEHDWAVVTNGLTLRILRDFYHTYTRGYVEFDLENLFTNRNYGDFRALYRLCHATRFIEPVVADEEGDVETPLEQLYQVALSTGVKVGQDLQENVVNALETLGNGFLDSEIEAALEQGGHDAAEDYYQDLLYVVYRLLFLMFAEQRGMMSQRDSLYTEEYSITKLRERAEQREKGDRNTDLWEGLKATFNLVGEGDERLGVPGYNGGLFDDNNLEYILDAECPNEKLLSAVDDLTHIEQEGYRQRISYADLGVEEIGAVYESLLEFTPQIAETAIELEDRTISPDSFYLDDRGMDRKETGSYYTDPSLVDELIQSALKPIVEDRVDEGTSTEVQEQQLLNITVCDPACGSGAFLIAANNFLGQRLAEIRSDSLYPDERTIRQAQRSVVQHCLYGVDKNLMAVELAKVSLWINSAVETRPLSFLDHRIKHGNSLIGTNPELISEGIPDDAYETSKGREYHVGTDLRRLVRNESKKIQSELTWYGDEKSEYISLAEKLDELKEEDISDISEKEELYNELRKTDSFESELLAYDVWTAAFYWPLEKYQSRVESSELDTDEYIEQYEDHFPTPKTIEKIRRNTPNYENGSDESSELQLLVERARNIAEKESFFHWPLEFPEVFSSDDGFDCILGNPPWDRLIFQEKEFFATTKPEIADAGLTKSERKDRIQKLESETPELYQQYQDAKRRVSSQKKFIKNSGRYPLTSRGIINIYAPFAELALTGINNKGSSGIIVPTRIATASNTQKFFQNIVENKNLSSLYDFHNKKNIFSDIDSRFKFSLLTLFGQNIPQDQFDLAFYLGDISELNEEDKTYRLSPGDIQAVNPNTMNCPTFRSQSDAELTVNIYHENSILKYQDSDKDIWGIDLRRMFNNTDDSDVFYRIWELENSGWGISNGVLTKDGQKSYPLYESKLVVQYDYRFATYEGLEKEKIKKKKPRKVTDSEKEDKSFSIEPAYWVKQQDYNSKWEFDEDWHVVLRKVTNPTNRRTVIASVVPKVATEDSVNHLIGCSAREATLLLACLNSYVLDFVSRQKFGGENLKQYITEQLPIPSRSTFKDIHINGEPLETHILDLTLKLMYTGEHLSPFVSELNRDKGPWSFRTPEGRDREELRFELEALIAHAYSRQIDDFEPIFDSFEQIKQEDKKEYGYYRTRDEIKSKFEELSQQIENNH